MICRNPSGTSIHLQRTKGCVCLSFDTVPFPSPIDTQCHRSLTFFFFVYSAPSGTLQGKRKQAPAPSEALVKASRVHSIFLSTSNALTGQRKRGKKGKEKGVHLCVHSAISLIVFTRYAHSHFLPILFFQVLELREKYNARTELDLSDTAKLLQIFPDVKDDILNEAVVCSEEEAVQLAGLLIQSNVGDHDPAQHKPGLHDDLKTILPVQYARIRGIEAKALEAHSSRSGQ